MTHLEQAYKFREAMEQPIFTDDREVEELQLNLIDEEFVEFLDALEEGQPKEDVLKELADLVFVCFQFASSKGWKLDEALDRVFASNMSKLVDGKPLRREDGKVLKGPNYQPPNLSDLV